MKTKTLIIAFVLFNLCSYSQVSTVTNTSTGKIWMDRNLGAGQVATSITDTASYGSLYQWGRLTDGHELTNSNTTAIVSTSNNPGHSDFIIGADDWITVSNDSLWQGLNGINNPCPNGFRIPTEAEWEQERLSWTTNDAAGAFASVLKLPVPGARSRMTGAIGNVGTFAGYRSSNLNGLDSRNLGISLSTAMMANRARADGNCVRCIQDSNTLVINKLNKKIELKIFPNPSSGFFTVNSEKHLNNIEFELIDLFGRKMKTGILNGQNSVIDINDFPYGIYILRLGDFTPQKIIKGK
ncbi:MAG: T9SS type A sorting domain-containing protein [Flavobacteriales bacterium]|nr:T9SS type A sorting domain-containing protein [Flavobacteriales bacterium]